MSNYSNKAGIIVRNSLEGKSNGTVDPMLSKIEDRIHDIAEFVRQRCGQDIYDSLLHHISSNKKN